MEVIVVVLEKTKSEFEARINKRKYARRARINKRLLLVGLLIILITVYLVTPLSRIREPIIVGNVIYKENEIFEKSELIETEFLFNSDYKKAIDLLTSDEFINSAKIYYDLFKCTIIIDEVLFLGLIENVDGKTYYLSNYTHINELELSDYQEQHLEKSLPLINFDDSLLTNEEEFAILIYGLGQVDASVRKMISKIEAYQDGHSLVFITITKPDASKSVNLVIENEKISTILKSKNVEYLLNEAKDQYPCYRYGISEDKKDIFIPLSIC